MDKTREHQLYTPGDFHPEEDSTLSNHVANGFKMCKVCGCSEDTLKVHYNCDMHRAYRRFTKGYIKNRPDLTFVQATELANKLWSEDILPLYK